MSTRRQSRRRVTIAFGVALLSSAAMAARAEAPAPPPICAAIEQEAVANGLPPAFLVRVLWVESRFKRDAVSPAGALGVAQFMPQTAADRGLSDPFDPAPAIAHAARFLAELRGRFGNLGLAAAAYDAGPGRVAKWLAAQAGLPVETRRYVLSVTGVAADAWARVTGDPPAMTGEAQPCPTVVTALAHAAPHNTLAGMDTPIGRALLRAAGVLSELPGRQHAVRVGESLCSTLRALGARCAVYNP